MLKGNNFAELILVTLQETKKCYLAELILVTLKGSKTQASTDKQGELIETNFKDEFTSYRVTSEKNAGKPMN